MYAKAHPQAVIGISSKTNEGERAASVATVAGEPMPRGRHSRRLLAIDTRSVVAFVPIRAEQWSETGGLPVATLTQRSLQRWVDQREGLLLKSLTESQKAVRHKCFVSYHHADEEEVKTFFETFENAFIPRVLGVSDEDDFIKSNDTGYIMDQIREKYVTDSTVTIVLNGKCTWARRYVD
jgi:MTH538 TIR-like domain (DUF1863)